MTTIGNELLHVRSLRGSPPEYYQVQTPELPLLEFGIELELTGADEPTFRMI